MDRRTATMLDALGSRRSGDVQVCTAGDVPARSHEHRARVQLRRASHEMLGGWWQRWAGALGGEGWVPF